MPGYMYYAARAATLLRKRLDLVVVSLIAMTLLPLAAVLVAVIVGVIAALILVLAAPQAVAAALLVLGLAIAVSVVVSIGVGYGGLSYAVLDAMLGVKTDILDPFKRAWMHKWRFTKVLLALVAISIAALLVLLLPLLPLMLEYIKRPPPFMGSEQAVIGFISRLYMLLAPLAAAGATLKLLLDPSYLYAASDWRGVGDAISRSLRGAAAMASLDPASTLAFFTLFLFPDVLLYVFPEYFLGNPLASNLFSLILGAKNMVVEPLFLLAAAMVGVDAGLLDYAGPGLQGPGAGAEVPSSVGEG